MTLRSKTTIENLGTTLTFPAAAGSATAGREILAGRQPTKWMTEQAAIDYSMALLDADRVRAELHRDPHSRRAVIHGPVGACWIATQVISDENGGYQVFAFYRSLDKDHVQADLDIQTAIAHMLVDRVTKVTMYAVCYHEYTDPLDDPLSDEYQELKARTWKTASLDEVPYTTERMRRFITDFNRDLNAAIQKAKK